MDTHSASSSPLHRIRRSALLGAGVGTLAGVIGWIINPASFYRAYLHSWLLWLDVSLGALGFVMIIHLVGGAWGSAIRRLGEAAAMVLPVMAVLFIPIAIGVTFGLPYPWADAGQWRGDAVLEMRRPFFNEPLFLLRSAIYGAIWIGLAWGLWRGSRRQENLSDPSVSDRLYALGGIGLVIYFLTMGIFASTDWIVSVEPHYYSTVFGLIVITGQGVAGLCVMIMTLSLLSGRLLPWDTVSADEWNDLGTVLLTATMMWCYLVVCQFVINWMANTQDQNHWYLQRMNNGFWALSWIIIFLHLAMPLFLLLFRRVKRSPTALFLICAVLLATRGLDDFMMINPSGQNALPHLWARFSWLDVVLPMTIGGFWIAGFTWTLGQAPLMIDRRASVPGASHAV